MDFYNELVLSALISIVLAFLLGKFAASGGRSPAADAAAAAVSDSLIEETQQLIRSRHVSIGPDPTTVDPVKARDLEKRPDQKEDREENREIERDLEMERMDDFGEDEEWEGIERSGIERIFAQAVKYVVSEIGKEKVVKLSNDLQMRLYGLCKVATEGPCYDHQPIAFKLSARAKWNAWQKLGHMNPELAMEQYVTLLNDCIPGWNVEETKDSDPQDRDLQVKSEAQYTSSEDSSHTNIDEIAVEQTQSNQGLTPTIILNLLSPTRVTFTFLT